MGGVLGQGSGWDWRWWLFVGGMVWLLVGCGREPEVVVTGTRGVVAEATATGTSLPIGVDFATRLPPTVYVPQITVTPLPTATPRPSATPRVHTIAEGDTFLGMAIAYNTTVAEIERLNPSLRANLLSIGQTVILPPPATPVFGAGEATPRPLLVTVRDVSTYRTPAGGLWILGEVVNDGVWPIDGLQVEIQLWTETGENLGGVKTWVAPSLLAPAARGPFGVLLPEEPAGWAYPVAVVTDGFVPDELGDRYLSVGVQTTEVVITGTQALATVEVSNLGESVAQEVVVVVTLYDDGERVVGYRQVRVENLAVGEVRLVEVGVAAVGGVGERVGVTYQAWE
ncbi:MAG TPA: LysM peptidoglycan-binding domain-containing protein [Anaerolineae bacterium]|nr:LysM peptidoglycan-binding domain-containing protein [Anaerolineae bacterium]